MIKKRWPFWLKLLVAPIAALGWMICAPIAVVLMFADYGKAEALMDFWMEQH